MQKLQALASYLSKTFNNQLKYADLATKRNNKCSLLTAELRLSAMKREGQMERREQRIENDVQSKSILFADKILRITKQFSQYVIQKKK